MGCHCDAFGSSLPSYHYDTVVLKFTVVYHSGRSYCSGIVVQWYSTVLDERRPEKQASKGSFVAEHKKHSFHA